MRLIDGRSLAHERLGALREHLKTVGLRPGLAAILVGDDPASHLYVRLKSEACQRVGLTFRLEALPATVTEAALIERIRAQNDDATVTGIIVQLPLPPGFDEDRVIAAIDPAKDADGFHPATVAAFLRGEPGAPTPSLIRAIWSLVAATGERLAGRTAVVLANSAVFAQGLVAFLERQGLRARTIDLHGPLRSATREADLLIVAVGSPKTITGADIKPGVIIIDVGTNQVSGRVVGDVDPDSVRSLAAWLSPVPGGVGPLTVVSLLESVIALAQRATKRLASR